MARQSRILLLGLLNHHPHHGYELEQELRRMNARLWAKLGRSTVYDTLNKLEVEGAVTARLEPASRGPGRRVFTITPQGRQLLEREIVKALGSSRPPVSDRVVGAAFAAGVASESVRHACEAALADLGHRLEQLALLQLVADDLVGATLITLYRRFYEAEREALEALSRAAPADAEAQEGAP